MSIRFGGGNPYKRMPGMGGGPQRPGDPQGGRIGGGPQRPGDPQGGRIGGGPQRPGDPQGGRIGSGPQRPGDPDPMSMNGSIMSFRRPFGME